MNDHCRPDPASTVGRRRPNVEQVGVAYTVGEQPRHSHEPVAIARECDVLRLTEGAAKSGSRATIVEVVGRQVCLRLLPKWIPANELSIVTDIQGDPRLGLSELPVGRNALECASEFGKAV